MAGKKKSDNGAIVKGGKCTAVTFAKDQCMFCLSREDNEHKYGKKYTKKTVCIHYFCMLFASGLCQNGRSDYVGILGFLIPDITREVKRASRLKCCYCKKINATIGCVRPNCRACFHYGCGVDNGALNQFFGNFREHRPMQASLPVSKKERGKKRDTCIICMCVVEPRPTPHTLYASCCKAKTWYHRDCLQRMAMTSGIHFFKCPLCNNKDAFQEEMMNFGIYIPDQDAAWELEPGAYQELLERHNQCDINPCQCPHGRDHNSEDTKWEIVLCDTCGSQGCHVKCARLHSPDDEWVCEECHEISFNAVPTQPKKKTKQRGRPPGTLSSVRRQKRKIDEDETVQGAPTPKKRRYRSRSNLSTLNDGTGDKSFGSPPNSSTQPSLLPSPIPEGTPSNKRLSLRRTSKKGTCPTPDASMKKTPMPKKEKVTLVEPPTSPVHSSPVEIKPQKLNLTGVVDKKPGKQSKITSYGDYGANDAAEQSIAGPSKMKTPRKYQRKNKTASQNNTLSSWLKVKSETSPSQIEQQESSVSMQLEETPPPTVPKRKVVRKKKSSLLNISKQFIRIPKKEKVEEPPYPDVVQNVSPGSSENNENILPISSTPVKQTLRRSITRGGKKQIKSELDTQIPDGSPNYKWLEGFFKGNGFQKANAYSLNSSSEQLPMGRVGMAITSSPSDHPRSNISIDSDYKQVLSVPSEPPLRKKRGRPKRSIESKTKEINPKKNKSKLKELAYEPSCDTREKKESSPKKRRSKSAKLRKSKAASLPLASSSGPQFNLLSYQDFYDFLDCRGILPTSLFERLSLYQSYKDGSYKLPVEDQHTNLSIEKVREADADSPVVSLVSPNDMPEEWPATPDSDSTLCGEEYDVGGSSSSGKLPLVEPLVRESCSNKSESDYLTKRDFRLKNNHSNKKPKFGGVALFENNLYESETESCTSSATVSECFLQEDGKPKEGSSHKSVPTSTVTSEEQLKDLECQLGYDTEMHVPVPAAVSSFEELASKAPLLDIPVQRFSPVFDRQSTPPPHTEIPPVIQDEKLAEECCKQDLTNIDENHVTEDSVLDRKEKEILDLRTLAHDQSVEEVLPSGLQNHEQDLPTAELQNHHSNVPVDKPEKESIAPKDKSDTKTSGTGSAATHHSVSAALQYFQSQKSTLPNEAVSNSEEKKSLNESCSFQPSSSYPTPLRVPFTVKDYLVTSSASLVPTGSTQNGSPSPSTSVPNCGPHNNPPVKFNSEKDANPIPPLPEASGSLNSSMCDYNIENQSMKSAIENRFQPSNKTPYTHFMRDSNPERSHTSKEETSSSLMRPGSYSFGLQTQSVSVNEKPSIDRDLRNDSLTDTLAESKPQLPAIQRQLAINNSCGQVLNHTPAIWGKVTGGDSPKRTLYGVEDPNTTISLVSSDDSDSEVIIVRKPKVDPISSNTVIDLTTSDAVTKTGTIDLTSDDEITANLGTRMTNFTTPPRPRPTTCKKCTKCGLYKNPERKKKSPHKQSPLKQSAAEKCV